MMMMGMHFMDGEVPFKKVYMHALVRDAKGQKMSKSKGNVMDPLEITEKFGADALRFTLTAMAAQGRDIKLSEERVEGYRNFATKLWNASRYCEMNECKASKDFSPATAEYTANKWIIGELVKTKTAIDEAMAAYKFNDAAAAIYQFTWGTFCDWYLEFTKPVLQAGGDTAEEVKQTTGWILQQILILLNPFMPFITEELYEQMISGDQQVMSMDWPEYDAALTEGCFGQQMNWFISLISEIRSVRADMNVPASAKIQLMIKDADEYTEKFITGFEDILKAMARLESVQFTDAAPKGSIQTIVEPVTLILPIADIIDLDAERARLKKRIDKLESDINKLTQKLDNKKFIENAPEQLVEEQKALVAEKKAAQDKFTSALKHLEAA
jgi:valyl-tRNA synthetase